MNIGCYKSYMENICKIFNNHTKYGYNIKSFKYITSFQNEYIWNNSHLTLRNSHAYAVREKSKLCIVSTLCYLPWSKYSLCILKCWLLETTTLLFHRNISVADRYIEWLFHYDNGVCREDTVVKIVESRTWCKLYHASSRK